MFCFRVSVVIRIRYDILRSVDVLHLLREGGDYHVCIFMLENGGLFDTLTFVFHFHKYLCVTDYHLFMGKVFIFFGRMGKVIYIIYKADHMKLSPIELFCSRNNHPYWKTKNYHDKQFLFRISLKKHYR